jgi:hypothetical protein
MTSSQPRATACKHGHPVNERHFYPSVAGNGRSYMRCRLCDAVRMMACRQRKKIGTTPTDPKETACTTLI